MKKTFVFLMVLVVLGEAANSQYKYGFKAGINLSNQVKNNTTPTPIKAQETKPLFGYRAGVFYKARLRNHFFISTEADLL